MRQLSVAGLIALMMASAAFAQVQPIPGDGDPHLQTIDYDARQVFQLRGAPGFQLMVELSPDEEVQSVALGDAAAWQVNVNKEGGRLFLKPTQGGATTNMTVVTSVRVYNFDLVALPEIWPDMPYTVQFRYPVPKPLAGRSTQADAPNAKQSFASYNISGDRRLRPVSVTDDGERTYIKWPATAPIPAVYASDFSGNEALLNGMMGTDDVYVVDGVPQRLTFRIDRSVAHADRMTKRKVR